MKVAVVGGGSTYTPELVSGLSRESERIDVRELVDRDPRPLPREARNELRRIRRPRTDDRELHPFTPVRVTPSTNARCARKKSTITGAITSSVAAIVRFH